MHIYSDLMFTFCRYTLATRRPFFSPSLKETTNYQKKYISKTWYNISNPDKFEV